MSPEDYLSKSHFFYFHEIYIFLTKNCSNQKQCLPKFKFPVFLFPTGADCKKRTVRKGRESKETGEERSRPCSASSWYEAENKSHFS